MAPKRCVVNAPNVERAECREGSFEVEFQHWNRLKESQTTKSDIKLSSCVLGCVGLEWILHVLPWSNKRREFENLQMVERDPDHLGVFLQLVADRAVRAEIEGIISLHAQNGEADHSVKMRAVMVASEERGYPKFIPLAEFNDAANGFVNDDKVRVSVAMKLHSHYRIVAGSTGCIRAAEGLGRLSSLEHDLLSLFRAHKGCDVVILAGGEEIQAHRTVLMARSAVFCAMLETGTFDESKQLKVVIDDIDAETMHALLNYLYSDELPQGTLEKEPDCLLAAADKYCIEGLRRLCEDCYLEKVTPYRAAELLVLADSRNCPRLKRQALEVVKQDVAGAVGSPGWMEHLSKNAELLNQVLGHIAGIQHPTASQEGSPRGTKRSLEA